MKGTQTREPLTKTVDLRADETIRNIAIQKNDKKILVLCIASRELVSPEAHFHRSCYKNYTTEIHEQQMTDSVKTEDNDPDTICSKKVDEAYRSLFEFIRNDVFQNPRVVAVSQLTGDTLQFSWYSGCER